MFSALPRFCGDMRRYVRWNCFLRRGAVICPIALRSQILENVGFTRNKKDGGIRFYRSVFAGAVSGAFGAFVGNSFQRKQLLHP